MVSSKHRSTVLTSVFGLLMITAICTNGQQTRKYRQVIEQNDVPQKVRAEFHKRYPTAIAKMWYVTHISYWYQDYGPSYYNAWYQPRTVVVYDFSDPANYEVEFLNGTENSRAIFSRFGVWFETRTRVNNLPEGVKKAIASSEFGDWSPSEYMERIEAPGMDRSVYRMQMTRKFDSHIIRVDEDGGIIQVKTQ